MAGTADVVRTICSLTPACTRAEALPCCFCTSASATWHPHFAEVLPNDSCRPFLQDDSQSCADALFCCGSRPFLLHRHSMLRHCLAAAAAASDFSRVGAAAGSVGAQRPHAAPQAICSLHSSVLRSCFAAAAADRLLLRGRHSCEWSSAGILGLAWHPSVAISAGR